jgi:hypothetical protein
MSNCICNDAAVNHSFANVSEAVYGAKTKNVILAGSELIADSDEKWMRLYRCLTCGTLWAEACYSSGHMDIYYLYPAPATDDPIAWLHEEASELPRP